MNPRIKHKSGITAERHSVLPVSSSDSGLVPTTVACVTKVDGLVLIGSVVVLIALAWWMPLRSVRILLAVTAAVLWVIALLAFLGVLALESIDTGPASMGCPLPGGDDSAVAASHWSWVPPGEVCEYPSGEVGPSYWRIPAAIALLAIPAGTTSAWPRRRNTRIRKPLAAATT